MKIYDVQKRIGSDEWLTVLSTYNQRDARTSANYLRKFNGWKTRVFARMEVINAQPVIERSSARD